MGAYLSSPKVDKESYDGGDLSVDPSRYGLSCMQGWRKNMEDSHICYNNVKIQEIGECISIYGVFDGHGGPNVSRWISYHFLPVFLKCLNIASEHLAKLKVDKNGEYYKLQLIKLSLEETFLKLDEEMRSRENQEKLKKYSAPQQKGDDDVENRDNYIYSILNDIVSKNISIKTVEKDGKKCLQVVYNKDENAVDVEGDGGVNDVDEQRVTEVDDIFLNAENTEITAVPEVVEEDSVASNQVEGSNNSRTTEDEWTLKKDDDTQGVSKEDSFAEADNGKESTKEGEKRNEGIKKEQLTEGVHEGSDVEKTPLGKGMDISAVERTEETNRKNGEILEDNITEENKETIAKRLKKDENAETGVKKEEYSYVGVSENKDMDIHGREETEKNVEAGISTEGVTTVSNDKPAPVKSNLTYENLKAKDAEYAKNTNLSVSGVSSISHSVEKGDNIENEINGGLVSHPKDAGFYEENENIKQLSIDEVLDSEDFRPFLEEVEDTEEDITEHVEDPDNADNIAYSCGSTAIVAVILKGYLLVANAGDSRAIVCFNGNSLGMSTDHKPHLEEEEMRIKRAGGYIANGRVDGNLNLTRAIGDLHYKSDPFLPQKDQKISAFPDIKCVTLTPEDEFLFLACDGIWDCKEGEEIVSFVKSRLNKFVEMKKGKDSSSKDAENAQVDYNKEKMDSKEEAEPSQEEKRALNSEQNAEIKVGDQMMDSDEKKNERELVNDEYKTVENNTGSATTLNKYEKFDKLSQICEELCDECLSSNCRDTDGIGCDNMTCLIVQYNPIYKSQTEKKFLDLDEIMTAQQPN